MVGVPSAGFLKYIKPGIEYDFRLPFHFTLFCIVRMRLKWCTHRVLSHLAGIAGKLNHTCIFADACKYDKVLLFLIVGSIDDRIEHRFNLLLYIITADVGL